VPDRRATLRDVLVVVLTLTTGAVDAVTFLRLGDVFSSVITGNLALLGIAVGRRESALAVSGGVALGGYALGILVGGAIAREPEHGQPVWPSRVTAALAVELFVLTAFGAGWLLTSARPAGTGRLIMLAGAAAAMGVQSAAVRRLGEVSSTYLTGTLTGVLVALSLRRRPGQLRRSLGVLAAVVVGAVAGAVTTKDAGAWAVVVVLGPVAVVVAVSVVTSLVGAGRRRGGAGEHEHGDDVEGGAVAAESRGDQGAPRGRDRDRDDQRRAED